MVRPGVGNRGAQSGAGPLLGGGEETPGTLRGVVLQPPVCLGACRGRATGGALGVPSNAMAGSGLCVYMGSSAQKKPFVQVTAGIFIPILAQFSRATASSELPLPTGWREGQPLCSTGPMNLTVPASFDGKITLTDGSDVTLTGSDGNDGLKRRFITPLYSGGWHPGSEFVFPKGERVHGENYTFDFPGQPQCACWAQNLTKPTVCPKSSPPCGLHGCCTSSGSAPRCRCASNWTGDTCDRRPWNFWPSPGLRVIQLIVTVVAFVLTTRGAMGWVKSAKPWNSDGNEYIDFMPKEKVLGSRELQHLQLRIGITWEYLQFGGTAFRSTVPWTAIDFANLRSLRSCLAYLRVLFKVVLVEYQPGFLWQFAMVGALFAGVATHGVRKWFISRTPIYKDNLANASSGASCVSLVLLVMSFLASLVLRSEYSSDNSGDIDELLYILWGFGGSCLVLAATVYLLSRTAAANEFTLFDSLVQVVLPEVLIPVVRRLFAPLLGCAFYTDDEYSTCGESACLSRMPTLRCSRSEWRYMLLLGSGTVLLFPLWLGILYTMVSCQADMNYYNPSKVPLLPKFVVAHGQLKVLVALATDCLKDQPVWMLLVLLAASCCDLAMVVRWRPNQHEPLNQLRKDGGVFAVWSCLCAFVALWIDDKTRVVSMLLFCAVYSAYLTVDRCLKLYQMGTEAALEWLCTAGLARLAILLLVGVGAVFSDEWSAEITNDVAMIAAYLGIIAILGCVVHTVVLEEAQTNRENIRASLRLVGTRLGIFDSTDSSTFESFLPENPQLAEQLTGLE